MFQNIEKNFDIVQNLYKFWAQNNSIPARPKYDPGGQSVSIAHILY